MLDIVFGVVKWYIVRTHKPEPSMIYIIDGFLDFRLTFSLDAYIKNPLPMLFAKSIFTSILKFSDKFI